MENNSGALLYIGSAYISSKKIIIFVTHPLFVTSLLIFTQIPPHTYIILVLAEKKIKIQNNADLTRNEASMGAEFLVKSALFCIFIFFCAKTSIIYVCRPNMFLTFFEYTAPRCSYTMYGNCRICSKLSDDLQSTRNSEHVSDVVRIYSEMFGIRCTVGRCRRFAKLSNIPLRRFL